MKKGEILDGEGGATVWGKLIPAKDSLLNETLPIGLAHGIKLNKDLNEDQILTWKDVDYSLDDPTVAYRRSMEKNFRSLLD